MRTISSISEKKFAEIYGYFFGKKIDATDRDVTGPTEQVQIMFPSRWLNRVMQDHEARASDLTRKLIFSFFLLFSQSKLLKQNKQGPKFAVQQSPLISRL